MVQGYLWVGKDTRDNTDKDIFFGTTDISEDVRTDEVQTGRPGKVK